MGLTKQLYDSYVLDGSMEINYYEKISYMRGLDKPKKNKTKSSLVIKIPFYIN